MQPLQSYQKLFLDHLAQWPLPKTPEGLYIPIDYMMHLGGKRMRPILALMGAEAFGAPAENALQAALAIEIFHNFSLVHDDIMDAAPLRRGKTTVHTKWDVNTGILSGDAMLILAYKQLEVYQGDVFKSLYQLLSKTALEVCEGQQMDVDFETSNSVSQIQYLKMIEFKTAVLVAAALKMGAIIAEASAKDQALIYAFGRDLGLAFQLQDDYLDCFGDEATFGKSIGGDILNNKKTVLYLHALEQSNEQQRQALNQWYSEKGNQPHKIEEVLALFRATGADIYTRSLIEQYTESALENCRQLSTAGHAGAGLENFAHQLMDRKV
ncbi:MAG: polyprenyl synthetase family protein [Flavobacteriaceae bacterium]|jgi:geranylgeranyl diphosphate synthase, type II|nr:polyprenyl synthetase family protein [Flavobacteriaceae bacterium]MDP4886161.1 polyprenyl synthetase family protein [Flavobacteriaceae bacterium]